MTELNADNYIQQKGPLFNQSPFMKIIYFALIALGSVFLFSFLGVVLIHFTHGINILTDPSLIQNVENKNVLGALKLLQLMNQLGLFIVPSFVIALLINRNISGYLSLRKIPDLRAIVIVILLALCALPFINFLAWLNQQMHLPSFLSGLEKWMRNSEDEAMKLTEAFMHMSGMRDLAVNMIIVAFMAALGEELLFRGVLQRLLIEWTGKKHLSVWLTAIIFSAIHMQFFGFIPRMLLGALFGYLLIWSGSIYLPILAHFINNGSAVLLSYFISRSQLPKSTETIGASFDDIVYALLSAIALIACVTLIYRHFKSKETLVNG